MKSLIYKINLLPDLTLIKYKKDDNGDVQGVIKKHMDFLRQWQGISQLYNIDLHLIYKNEPTMKTGNKLGIYLCFIFSEDAYANRIEKILYASPLSVYYRFEKIDIHEKESIQKTQYQECFLLKKTERIRYTEDEDNNIPLYTVEGYEANIESRLYSFIQTMSALQERCSFVLSLKGIDAYKNAFAALNKPISFLRKKQFRKNNEIVLSESPKNNSGRDVVSENTLKCYEDFLNTTTKSPCFKANIKVYSDTKEVCEILLNIASGEAIEGGNCNTYRIEEKSIISEIKDYSDIMPDSLKFWPTTFSIEEVGPFFRFPVLYDGEYIDIKKETAPILSRDGICLGETTEKDCVKIEGKDIIKHAFVCGVPGSGKTNTMLHLANSLYNMEELKFGEIINRKIPFLILEPAKREYRELSLFDIPDLMIFSPSANTKFPLQINPFEFPIGLTLSEHINMLVQVFQGAFPMQAPAPFILDRSIEEVYIKKGWKSNDINLGDKEYPRISDLYEEFKNQLEKTNYDGEIRGNIQSVLEMRIGSLLRREKKDIFDVSRSILSPEEWMSYPIIVELESLGKETANFVTLLLCTLIRETLKVNPMAQIETAKDKAGNVAYWKPLRHVIFIEEAHNLIASQNEMDSNSDSNPKIAATECIINMLKEVRALREGIIIADQLPTSMATDVIKNTNIKIVHRLTSGDDRGLIGSTMSASELQVEQVSTFLPGEALLTYEGMLKPFLVNVVNIEQHGVDTPNDSELYKIMKEKRGQSLILKRLEYRKLKEIQDKIYATLKLENVQRKAIRELDFNSKSEQQIESILETCTMQYQAIEIIKKMCQSQLQKISKEFVQDDELKKTEKIIESMSTGFREDMILLINKYM